MDLSLAKLQHLTAVAECGSFSRAAAELNLSQPALSRSIAALEDRYGFKLFNRLGHGVEPTAAGLQVLEQAKPILQGLLVFESNLRLLGEGLGGRLAMGMAPLIASQLVARFSGLFFSTGEVQLKVMIRPGEDLMQALRNDEVELIVFPESHLPDTDEIDVELLGLVRPACVVRRGHPLLDHDRLLVDDLRAFPWASSLEAAVGPKVPSRSRMICENYHILREAVIASDLVCICSHAFVARELRDGTLAEIFIEDLPLGPTRIHAARLRGRVFSPLASRALDAMREDLAIW
jgi:DNA-binding transcriptional LysR family regulator